MDEILCDISAFRYYRVPPQAIVRMPPLPHLCNDRGRFGLTRHPLVEHALGVPVHLLDAGATSRWRGNRVVRHDISARLPMGSIRETPLGFSITSPQLTLLNLANHVSKIELALMIYEMCGTFAVFKPDAEIEELLEDSVSLVGVHEWRRTLAAGGRGTALWQRRPLLKIEELSDFANQTRGHRGSRKLLEALQCVTGIAASPLEVQASLLLGMSRRRGGAGFKFLRNNWRIDLTRPARQIYAAECCYADIYIENDAHDRCVIIECQGHVVHDGEAASTLDSNRTTALQSMGYEVILVTFETLFYPERFDTLVRLICRKLGMRYRPKTELQRESEDRLRRAIFIDWASMP